MIFIDLDDTLIDHQTAYRIIDKRYPDKVLMELDSTFYPMLKSAWRKDNLKVESLDKTYWLSRDIWEKLIKRNKKLLLINIDIVSVDKGIAVKNKEVFGSALRHLRQVKGNVSLFVNLHLDNTHDYLNDVIAEVKDSTKRNEVYTYYIDDIQGSDEMGCRDKMRIILEQLVGFRIKLNKFVDKQVVKQPHVRYYTGNKRNSELVVTMQDTLEGLLKQTDKAVQQKIKSNLQVPSTLQIGFITPNTLNAFQTSTITIEFPRYIKTFERYNSL